MINPKIIPSRQLRKVMSRIFITLIAIFTIVPSSLISQPAGEKPANASGVAKLLRRADGAVFYVDNNVRRLVPNLASLNCLQQNANLETQLLNVSNDFLTSIPEGPPIPSGLDGTLYAVEDQGVFLIKDCRRLRFADPNVIRYFRQRPAVVVMKATDLDLFPASGILEKPTLNSQHFYNSFKKDKDSIYPGLNYLLMLAAIVSLAWFLKSQIHQLRGLALHWKNSSLQKAVQLLFIFLFSIFTYEYLTKYKLFELTLSEDGMIVKHRYHFLLFHIVCTLVAPVLIDLLLAFLNRFAIYSSGKISWLSRQGAYGLSLVLATSILLISSVVYFQYIFLDELFLFCDIGSDTANHYYPEYLFFVSKLRDFPIYTFSEGLGGVYINSLVKNLLNPFNFFYLVAGFERIAHCIIYVNILKIILSGIIFLRFLLLFTSDKQVSLLFSIIYAFNGFLIVNGHHFEFATHFVYFTLFLFSLELYMQKGKWLLLLLSSMMVASTFYFLYMTLFAYIVYLVFRQVYFSENLSTSFRKFIGSSAIILLAVLIMSIVLIPQLHALMNTPRVSLGSNKFTSIFSSPLFQTEIFYLTLIGKSFSNTTLGYPANYFGWYNFYEAPHLYSGLLTMLMLPFLFLIRDARSRFASISLFFFLILLVSFPFFAQILNGFQYPSYRWTFIPISLLILLGAISFSNIRKEGLSKMSIGFSGLIILAFIAIFYYYSSIKFDDAQLEHISLHLKIAASFLFFYLLILFFFNIKNIKTSFWITLIVVLEMSAISIPVSLSRVSLPKSMPARFDETDKLLREISSSDSSLFFRTEKTYYSRAYRDAMAQDYFGIKTYQSVQARSWVNFANTFGLNNQKHYLMPNPVRPDVGRPTLLDMLGFKYLIADNPNNFPKDPQYQPYKSYKQFVAFKNKNFKPIAIPYDFYIESGRFAELEDNIKHCLSQTTLVLESGNSVIKDALVNFEAIEKDGDVLMQAVATGDKKRVEKLLEAEPLLANYLSLQSGASPLHTAVKNNNWEIAEILIDKGARLDIVDLNRYLAIDLCDDNLKRKILDLHSSKRAASGNTDFVLKTFSSSQLDGTFSNKSPKVLFFSVLYDKNWIFTINNENVPTYLVNGGCTAVITKQGKNSISLQYHPSELLIGMKMSFGGIILFLLVFAITRKKKVV